MLYVIPTFGWDPPRPRPVLKPGGSLKSVRKGGGLRVYLDRPWYSSGDGELLGVVLRAGGAGLASENDPMKHVITTWGQDVIRLSKAPPANVGGQGPATADFVGFKQIGAKLTLDEQPPPSQSAGWTQVDVVGYSVQFDEERKLWYADILVNPGQSYFPFIRLALARFQPDSVAGAELSRVVLCDIMQLLPDRTFSVNASADGKTLQVTDLQGVFPLFVPPDLGFQFATLQERSTTIPDPGGPIVPVIPDTGADPIWGQRLSFFVTGDFPAKGFTLLPGTISSPEPIGSGKYRLVVREYRYFGPPGPFGGAPLNPQSIPTGPPWRLVYMDIVDM